MQKSKQGLQLTNIILNTFHMNGVLTHVGDRLTQEYGLSSARWKVLGAIVESNQALSVAEIARQMGLTRQAVQRLSNEMVKDGLLTYKLNPNHQRAKLVVLSKQGKEVYKALDVQQSLWVNELASHFDDGDLDTTAQMLKKIIKLLEPNHNITI